MRGDRDVAGLTPRAAPRTPHQPYSELELVALGGLLVILLGCAAYLGAVWFGAS